MPDKLFNLRGVPEDEAGEIRALLDRNNIDYFETPAGNWGVSAPAIWLNDTNQRQLASSLLDQYQHERRERVRAEYAQMRQAGRHSRLIDVIRENPLHVIVTLVAIAVVLYFSIKPFLDFGQ